MGIVKCVVAVDDASVGLHLGIYVDLDGVAVDAHHHVHIIVHVHVCSVVYQKNQSSGHVEGRANHAITDVEFPRRCIHGTFQQSNYQSRLIILTNYCVDLPQCHRNHSPLISGCECPIDWLIVYGQQWRSIIIINSLAVGCESGCCLIDYLI